MEAVMKTNNTFAYILIAIGTVLMLNQFDLIEFTRPLVLIMVSAALSLILFRKSWISENKSGFLGGTFFLILTILFAAMEIGYLPLEDKLIFPLIITALGASNLAYYAVSRSSFTNVSFGIIFLLIGLPMLGIYFSELSYWEVGEIFSRYWPVLIILLGIGFLIDGMYKRAKKS